MRGQIVDDASSVATSPARAVQLGDVDEPRPNRGRYVAALPGAKASTIRRWYAAISLGRDEVGGRGQEDAVAALGHLRHARSRTLSSGPAAQ